MDIIEDKHPLWKGIEPEKRECVRGFLVQFESEVLHRAHRNFNFRGGSIGNFFLCAMQRFFRSIQSAIFLFSAIADIPVGLPTCRVLPAINTNSTTTIAAALRDNTVLMGQCEISHPPASTEHNGPYVPGESQAQSPSRSATFGNETITRDPADFDTLDDREELGEPEASKCENRAPHEMPLRKNSLPLGNIVFNKGDEPPLSSPIERVFYVNSYGHEIFPYPNPSYLLAIERSNTLIYSCGSLWTSIVPCLALRGLASAIAMSQSLERKVMILNSTYDRETFGMCASDFVRVICGSLNHANDGEAPQGHAYPARSLVSHVLYPVPGDVALDRGVLEELGITCVPVHATDKRINAEGMSCTNSPSCRSGNPVDMSSTIVQNTHNTCRMDAITALILRTQLIEELMDSASVSDEQISSAESMLSSVQTRVAQLSENNQLGQLLGKGV